MRHPKLLNKVSLNPQTKEKKGKKGRNIPLEILKAYIDTILHIVMDVINMSYAQGMLKKTYHSVYVLNCPSLSFIKKLGFYGCLDLVSDPLD